MRRCTSACIVGLSFSCWASQSRAQCACTDECQSVAPKYRMMRVVFFELNTRGPIQVREDGIALKKRVVFHGVDNDLLATTDVEHRMMWTEPILKEI